MIGWQKPANPITYPLLPLRYSGHISTKGCFVDLTAPAFPQIAAHVRLWVLDDVDAADGLDVVMQTSVGEIGQRPGQGMIGTADSAFIGDPSITRLLIAT